MPPRTFLTLITILLSLLAQAQQGSVLALPTDTALLHQLAVELRASMGSDRFHDLVDSLGTLANKLARNREPAVRAAAAEGRLHFHRFASWDACFRSRFSEAVHHADTVDRLLGDRSDREALTIKRSSERARMSVYDEIDDTASWRRAHEEDIRICWALEDSVTLLDAYTMSATRPAFKRTTEEGIERALTFIHLGSESVSIRAHWYLGRILWSNNRQAEALPHVLASRPFALDGSQNAWMLPMYHDVLGYCYRSIESPEMALQHYDSCMHIAAKGGLLSWYCTCASDKALLFHQLGDNDAAFDLNQRAYDTATAHGLIGHIASKGWFVADHLRRIGKWREALEVSDAYHAAKDSMDNAASGRLLASALFQGQIRADSLAHAADLAVQDARVRRQRLLRNSALVGSVVLGSFALVFLFQRNRISKEKDRSEELLLNILPLDIAEELKAKGEADARLIDEVTILFTDFKGFTAISEQLTARELVDELNECFKAFDHIITARGIEKIKTIGDAYMCAGGLAGTKGSSPLQVVLAALEMQDYLVKRKAERAVHGLPGFDMRLGIHTGPVVAGIVGVKKFQYDIWGDTVNIASRMESSGEIGEVNISEATYTLVNATLGLRFTPRGKVQAKGKGEMEMYFVTNT